MSSKSKKRRREEGEGGEDDEDPVAKLQRLEEQVESALASRLAAEALAQPVARERRRKPGLNFVRPGRYVESAKVLRMRQLTQALNAPDKVDEKQLEAAAEVLEQKQEESRLKMAEQILQAVPDTAEWWDAALLTASGSLDESLITRVVEMPVPVRPVASKPPPPPQPVLLTKKERRKMKRMQQLAKQQELRDLQMFGVVPAPEPRLTLKNMYRVMGQEAYANPSAAEALVRKQMAERAAKHEAHNEANRLTKEQRAEKRRRKLAEDTSTEVQTALFVAGDMRPPQVRFKIDVTTQQFNLTGMAIIHPTMSVLVVEGGPKGIRFFKRVVLHRLKWRVFHEEGEEDEKEKNKQESTTTEGKEEKKDDVVEEGKRAELVWEGALPKRHFSTFQFVRCPAESLARKVLADNNCTHYWELCKQYVKTSSSSSS